MDDRIGKNYELAQFLKQFIGEQEIATWMQLWQGMGKQHIIRVNPLKVERQRLLGRLSDAGFEFEPLSFYEYAYRIKKLPVELGKTIEHFLGYFYIQSTSSMLPALALNPLPEDTVLDIAAAPGSKTTQMAEMMRGRGVILANDIAYSRVKTLRSNVDRMGALNVIVKMGEGYKLMFDYRETFDKVLVDAPCSALGTLYKTGKLKFWWSYNKVRRLTKTQKGLILAGFETLKKGGVMVYSTCTIVPSENEGIVNYLLLKRKDARLEALTLPVKTEKGLVEYRDKKYSEQLSKTARIYPSSLFPEAFYIAKIRKI